MTRLRNHLGFSSFVLKIIALLSMLSCHIAIVFVERLSYDTALMMYYFGKISFPIFAFFIANGWKRTHNKPTYALRVLAMALASQIPYAIVLYNASFTNLKSFFISSPLNIGFSFLLAMLSLFIFDLLRKMSLPKLISAACAILPALLFEGFTPFHVDYGYRGVLLVLVMYITSGDDALMFLSCGAVLLAMCASFTGMVMTVSLNIFFCYLASLALIMLYNGRKGARTKYLFYVFYPLHLILLRLFDLYIL